MSDNYPVDTTDVRKNGMRGVLSTGAGIGLLLFNGLLNIPILGWIISGALIVLGALGLVGKQGSDKTTGSILIGAGALGVASFVLKGLTGTLLGIGGVGLIGFGIFNLFKFVKGLKSRS
ncbi:MAG: hypothetical protein E4H20_06130 [Spirochaetales bacterium]|nr:MAG: hypothetical protein E4H20_06130 [Spirochaetales bacterium]